MQDLSKSKKKVGYEVTAIKNGFNQNSLIKWHFVLEAKTNEIANNFLLPGDEFMPEIYLRQPRFTYSEPFTKNKTNYKYLKKQDNQYIFIKMS